MQTCIVLDSNIRLSGIKMLLKFASVWRRRSADTIHHQIIITILGSETNLGARLPTSTGKIGYQQESSMRHLPTSCNLNNSNFHRRLVIYKFGGHYKTNWGT